MEPFTVSVKDEAINPDYLIPGDANPVDEILFIADGNYGGNQPAIPDLALLDIASRSAIDIELRVGEYILLNQHLI